MQWPSCSPAISMKILTVYATVSPCWSATIQTRFAFADFLTTTLILTNHSLRNASKWYRPIAREDVRKASSSCTLLRLGCQRKWLLDHKSCSWLCSRHKGPVICDNLSKGLLSSQLSQPTRERIFNPDARTKSPLNQNQRYCGSGCVWGFKRLHTAISINLGSLHLIHSCGFMPDLGAAKRFFHPLSSRICERLMEVPE